jgi:O-antigen/teichoic acid export membrane protein
VTESEPESGYATKAASGVAWQGMAGLLVRLLRALVFLALARLIAPDDFGVVALAMVFVTTLQFLSGVGFSNAIIHLPELRKSHLDTALVVNLLIGLFLSAGLAGSAGFIAEWTGQHDLKPILLALAVMPVLTGVSMVPEGLLTRNMQFRTTSIRHLIACVISVVVALSLAWFGAGAWALVAQTLTEAVIALCIISIATRRLYKPGLQVSWQSLCDLLPIGGKMLGQVMVSQVISMKADDFLIGTMLGSFQLGLYSVAYRLLTVLQDSLIGVALGVAFPTFSRLQGDPDRLARGYFRVSQLIFSITGATFVFVALTSNEIVPLLLGRQWIEAAPIMSVLALSGVAFSIVGTNTLFLQATGGAGRALTLTIVAAAADVVAFALSVRFGIFWVAVALAVRMALFVPISAALVAPRVGGAGQILRRQLPVLACMIVPLATGLLANGLQPFLGGILAVALAALVGVPAYFVALRLVVPSVYLDAMSIVQRFVRGRRARMAVNA